MAFTSKTTLFVALGLFTAGTVAGFVVGRKSSTNSGDPATAHHYLVLYGHWKHLAADKGQIILRAGPRSYAFTTGDKEVEIHYLPEEMLKEPPKQDFDEKDLEKLMAFGVAPAAETSVAAVLLKGTEESEGKFRAFTRAEQMVITAGTLGAAALGYYLGHRSKPDFDNTVFQNTLKDVALWRDVESEWRQVYELEVVRLMIRTTPFGKGEQKKLVAADAFLGKFLAIRPEIESQAMNDPLVKGDSETPRH